MTLELYYLEETDSICSNRVVVALWEKGITDWTPHKMQLVERDQFKPAYLDLNPQGVVPTLVHDGRPIRESSLITDYLDDLKPSPALKPVNLAERSRMKEWVKLFDERGYEATALLISSAVPSDNSARSDAGRRANIDRLYRQRSVITDRVELTYVIRAIGAFGQSSFSWKTRSAMDDRSDGDRLPSLKSTSARS